MYHAYHRRKWAIDGRESCDTVIYNSQLEHWRSGYLSTDCPLTENVGSGDNLVVNIVLLATCDNVVVNIVLWATCDNIVVNIVLWATCDTIVVNIVLLATCDNVVVNIVLGAFVFKLV